MVETTTEGQLISMEDILFNEAEPEAVAEDTDGFTLVLALSPEPFNLVKGFEFKMLNK